MSRATISDIARACGVSPTAVSFALNDRPGVSEARRAEIVATARAMGWTPSAAARALSTSRVGAVGLVIASPLAAIARDAFYMRLIAGIERGLAGSPDALVLKIVGSLEDEVLALRRWYGEHRVDGVILVNPREKDPRPALVHELGMSAVFVGDTRDHPSASSVTVDDFATMSLLLEDIAALGHVTVDYIHAASPYRHRRERLRALEAADAAGLVRARTTTIDEMDEEGAAAAIEAHARSLAAGPLPDVLLCEDEWITLALLGALARRGVHVPRDVALASWESTAGMSLRAPAIASVERDPEELGAAAVGILRDIAGGGGPLRREMPHPRLVVRDSLLRPERVRDQARRSAPTP